MKNSIAVFLLLAGTLVFFACGNHKEHAHDADGNHIEAKAEFTSDYVCPMHCDGSGSDKAGSCPVCGMDYVALADHKSDGHEHDEEGHDHDGEDHDGHSHN